MSPPSLFDQVAAALATDYELIRLLGQGGMASVFLAREKSLKRLVAIKVLAPDLAGPAFRTRFGREAETAAQLQHPNIVPIYRVGEASGLAYYAMAYVEGESLADRMARENRLPLDDVVRIGSEVAGALAAAHRRGIIHRDVKPQNILLEAESGRVLVTDFGIASIASSTKAGAEDDAERLTGLGMVMGTPRYMSPEQAAGERDLTPAADMYSLGIVLYEMLTADYPYRDNKGPRAMVAHLSQVATPVRERNPDVPERIAGAVDALLDKKPEQRPGPAALRVSLGGEFEAPPPRAAVSPSRSRRVWLGAVAGGIAIVLALGTVLWKRSGPPRGVNPRQSLLIGFFENTSRDPRLEWLRLGGVDLLSQALRRWQDLQVVEPERLLDLARRAGVANGERLSQESALDMARAAGVWTATIGTIVPVNDQLRISLNVYDVSSGKQLTRASAQVAEANLASAFDSLASQVLDLADVPRGALVDVDPPTRSIEAYRAYIEGIEARSRWELDSASAAFRRAIDLDPRFALAYYELSQAVYINQVLSPSPEFIGLADSALRYAQGRPPRERLLVEAYQALVHADFPKSRQLYRDLLASDSLIADAWTGLGIASQLDMTLRKNAQGQEYLPTDMTTAKRAYERALSLDGSDHRVYANLASLLATAGLEETRALAGFREVPQAIHLIGNRFPVRFYAILMQGDSLITVPAESLTIRFPQAQVDSLRRLARARARAVIQEWTRVAPDEGQAYLIKAAIDRLDKNYDGALGALAMAERLKALHPVPFPMQRLAVLLDARRLQAAARLADSLDTGAPVEGNRGLVLTALVNARFMGGDISRGTALMNEFFRAATSVTPDSQVSQFFSLLRQLVPLRIRASLDQASAADARRGLELISRVPESMRQANREVWNNLTAAMMFVAAASGDTATVNRWIGTGQKRPSLQAFASAVAGDRASAERHFLVAAQDTLKSSSRLYAMGRVAEYLGRQREALRYYAGVDSTSLDTGGPDPDWLLLVRSYNFRAGVYEALGDAASAREYYRRFVTLWDQADPALQGEVSRARAALAELERADRRDR